MNKLLTKIVGVVLGTTMAVGVGVGVAVNNNRDVVDSQVDAAGSSTYTVTSISGSYSADGGTATENGITWTYDAATYCSKNSSKVQVGSSKNPQTSNWTYHTPISSFGSGKKVTAVSLTAYTTATTATYDISVGGSSVKSGSLATSSSTFTANSLNATSGEIVFTLKGSSSSKAMYICGFSVTYEDGAAPAVTPEVESLDLVYDNPLVLDGQGTETSASGTILYDVTYTTGKEGDGEVTVETSNANLTAEDDENGTITLSSSVEGDYTVKITTVDEDENGDNVSEVINVSVENIYVAPVLSYEIVTDADMLVENTTFVLTTVQSSTTYVSKGLSSGHAAFIQKTSATTITGTTSGSTLTSSETDEFTLKGTDGAWKIKYGDSYLKFTGSSNGNDSFDTEANASTFSASIKTGGYILFTCTSTTGSGRVWRPSTETTKVMKNYATNSGVSDAYMYANIPTKPIVSTRMVSGTVSASTDDTEWTLSGFKFFVTYEGESETEVTDRTTFNVTEAVPTISASGSMDVTVTPTFKNVQYTEKAATVSATLTFIDKHNIQYIYDAKQSGDSLDFDGVYMGDVRDGIVVMNGAYGMCVYYGNDNVPEHGYTIGATKLHVTGNLEISRNLYRVASADKNVEVQTDATRLSNIAVPVIHQLSGGESTSDLTVANRKTHGIGVVKTITDTASGGHKNLTFHIKGTADNATVNVFAAQAFLDSSVTEILEDSRDNGTEITIEGFTSFYNNFQVQFTGIVAASETYHAVDFAQDLLDLTDTDCSNYDPINNPNPNNITALAATWVTLQDSEHYLQLSKDDKDSLVDADAVEHANPQTNQEIIEAAMARYEMLVNKYGVDKYGDEKLSDFIGRNVLSTDGSNSISGLARTQTNNIIVVVVISSVVVMASIGGYFLLRKRKEQ